MTEATQSAPAAATTAAPAVPAAKKSDDSSRVTITLLRKFDAEKDKLPNQAKAIVKRLEALGLNKPIGRQDLVKQLEDNKEISTRQTVDRIVGYYQPKLVEDGFIKIDKLEKPKSETAAKPAGVAAKPAGVAAAPAGGTPVGGAPKATA